jgi:hypothetical protein
MYKILTILLISLFSIASIKAQNNIQEEKLPVIEFDKKRHTFKDLVEGTYGECVFIFKNTGNAPLKLLHVKTSCGCTSPQWPRQPIQPGDSNFIKVVFNSKGYAGRDFAKAIIVTTNIPNKVKQVESTKYVLTIIGNVISKDDLIPQDTTIKVSSYKLSFGEIKHGETAKVKLRVINTGKDTLTIKQVQKSSDLIQISNYIDPIPPGSFKILNVSIDTHNYTQELFVGIIKIITNIPVKQTKKLSKEGIVISGKIYQNK